MTEKKLQVRLIFEMLGKPKEHLEEVLGEFVEKLGKENNVSLSSKTLHEAKPVEEKDKEGNPVKTDLFTTFAEVELEVEDIPALVSLMFRYLPAHVEIIYPEQFEHSNIDLNMVLNDLIVRLHHYDAIAKAAILQNQMLAKRFEEMKEAGISGIDVVEKKDEKEVKKDKKKKTN